MKPNIVLLVINVDWYFLLHWKQRAIYLRESGYQVIVCTNITSVANRDEILSLDLELREIAFVRHKVDLLNELRCLHDLWRVTTQKNIYLLHAITIKPIIFTLFLGVFLQFRSIFTFPGLGQLSIKRNLKIWCVWRFLSITTHLQRNKNKKIYTFENDSDKQRCLRECSKRLHCFVIPGAGVDMDSFYPSLTKHVWPVKILFASRLLKSKGLEAVIRSLEVLVSRGFDVELHVAGMVDTTHIEAYSKGELSSLLIDEHIVWRGHCSDMPNLLRQVDIVCLPTKYGEGMPRILLEGAATGLPLVATDVPGCKEVVIDQKTGFLIDPDDSTQLTAALQRLVEDPVLRASFGERGRLLVQEKMSDAVVCERTLSLYKSLGLDKLMD